MSIRQIRDELEVLLTPICVRYGKAFPRNLILERNRLDEDASAIAAGTMPARDVWDLLAATEPAPQFWQTTLGQHLYRLSAGQPEATDTVTAPVAHNVLRVVRQRIDQYVMAGQLERVPDLPVRVTGDSLLKLWTERNPGGPS